MSPLKAETKLEKIRFYYLHNRSKIFETQNYYIDRSTGYLSNKACLEEKCLKSVTKTYSQLLEGKKENVGTNGFWICHNLKGSPQIIKVLTPLKKIITMDRCMLKNGGVIDTISLEKYFKSLP